MSYGFLRVSYGFPTVFPWFTMDHLGQDTGTWRQGRVWLPRASTKRVPSTAPWFADLWPFENHGKTLGKWWFNGVLMGFTLWLCQNSYGKRPCIVDFPIVAMVIFYSYVKLPEGSSGR